MVDHRGNYTGWGKLTRRNMFMPDEQWEGLVKLSKREKVTVTELVRRAVQKFLEDHNG